MLSLFTTLLLAHLLGDFPLQTDKIYALKLKGGLHILPHIFVHVLVTGLLLNDWRTSWPLLLALGVIHFGIDWFKVAVPLVSPDVDFIIDQAMHLATLFLLASWMPFVTPLLPMNVTLWGAALSLIPAVMMFGWVYALTQPKAEPVTLWMRDSMCIMSQRTGWVITLGVFMISVVMVF